MTTPNRLLDALAASFRGPEHEPFTWECDEPGAMLIHGFLGSPDEVRPLAEVLCEAGWTAHVPLLPGFGPDIQTLYERTHKDWYARVENAWRSLRQEHRPALLVGFSMGSALAVQTAARLGADGVIIVSPFWKVPFGNFWLHVLGPPFQLLLGQIRPFRLLDLDNRDLRQGIRELMPGLDLDDPDIRAEIRSTPVPVRILLELQRCGAAAYRAAGSVVAPMLVIQGTEDEIVLPSATRRLRARFSGPVTYRAYTGSHELLRTTSPAWDGVRQSALDFAGGLLT